MTSNPKTVIANGREVPSWSTLRLAEASPPMIGGIVLTRAEATPIEPPAAPRARMGTMANTGPNPKVVTAMASDKLRAP